MCTYFRFRIYAHMWQAVNHALCKANICLWSTLSNSLSVWMSVWMYLFCLLCMYNMSMYICIRVLSTVGTGALICCIIVLYLLYWIKKKSKKSKRHRDRERKPELTHVFKNKSFDISLHPMLASFFMWGVSLRHPALASFILFFFI